MHGQRVTHQLDLALTPLSKYGLPLCCSDGVYLADRSSVHWRDLGVTA